MITIMKKCCFIIPYFGNFPNYFSLFLKTCSWNKDFNWLIITDNNVLYDYPDNFKVVKMSFEKLKFLFQSKFDFNIKLDTPYKLCDYKPAYGYLFEDYIKDFKYWGHCDVDTIIGNLSQFLTPIFDAEYDKIFCLGHMTLYKNSIENNRVFMSNFNGRELYKEVFSSSNICWFDETWKDENNINEIFKSLGKKIYEKDLSFNIYIPHVNFIRTTYVGKDQINDGHGYSNENFKKAIYVWDSGNLYRVLKKEEKILKEEFLYMHFQYRKMEYSQLLNTDKKIKIIPNKFLPLEVDRITVENFDKIKKSSICFHYVYAVLLPKFRRLLKKIKNI